MLPELLKELAGFREHACAGAVARGEACEGDSRVVVANGAMVFAARVARELGQLASVFCGRFFCERPGLRPGSLASGGGGGANPLLPVRMRAGARALRGGRTQAGREVALHLVELVPGACVVEGVLLGDRTRAAASPRECGGARDNQAIIRASQQGYFAVVDRLLQDGRVGPSARNNAAIIRASERGQLELVDRLLRDERVNPSAQNNEAIIQALKYLPAEYHLYRAPAVLSKYLLSNTED